MACSRPARPHAVTVHHAESERKCLPHSTILALDDGEDPWVNGEPLRDARLEHRNTLSNATSDSGHTIAGEPLTQDDQQGRCIFLLLPHASKQKRPRGPLLHAKRPERPVTE